MCNNIVTPEDSVITNCTSGVSGFGREADECIVRYYNFSELWTCQQNRSWTTTASMCITLYVFTQVYVPV